MDAGRHEAWVDFAPGHAVFAGHFPGRPVVPGALLLAHVLEALADTLALAARLGSPPLVEQAKFLLPVGPGARVRITLREAARGVAFEIHDDAARLVAHGALR
jgi:3-hydroxyacyl-[acyl-carrier-protein] dehydratase